MTLCNVFWVVVVLVVCCVYFGCVAVPGGALRVVDEPLRPEHLQQRLGILPRALRSRLHHGLRHDGRRTRYVCATMHHYALLCAIMRYYALVCQLGNADIQAAPSTEYMLSRHAL